MTYIWIIILKNIYFNKIEEKLQYPSNSIINIASSSELK